MNFHTSTTLPADIDPSRVLRILTEDEATRPWEGQGFRATSVFVADSDFDADVLVTSTPTLATVAAMARFLLRRLDLWPAFAGGDTDYPAAEQRCDEVVRAMLWQPPRGWIPRPLPTIESPWGPEAHEPIEGRRSLAHVHAIARGKVKSLWPIEHLGADIIVCGPPPLAHRVAIVACWLLWGDTAPEVSVDRAAAHRIHNECGIVRCRQVIHCEEAERALALARTMVDAARVQLVADAWAGGNLEAVCPCGEMSWVTGDGLELAWTGEQPGCSSCGAMWQTGFRLLAVTRSAQPGAVHLAHHVAPVVIRFGARGSVEISAPWPGFVGLGALWDDLDGQEQGWLVCPAGDTIINGPLGGSILPEADVIAAVRRCLR